jgi:hypothetical protein
MTYDYTLDFPGSGISRMDFKIKLIKSYSAAYRVIKTNGSTFAFFLN